MTILRRAWKKATGGEIREKPLRSGGRGKSEISTGA